MLNKVPIILASASPRRSELLKQVGIYFDIIVSEVDENIDISLPPELYVKTLAELKSKDVSKKLSDGLVIGADTIVVFDNLIMNKPIDLEDAYNMLFKLQGKTHQVFTGVSIFEIKTSKLVTFVSKTKVKMYKLTHEQLNRYLKTNEYKDKAGSYGIQGFGTSLIKEIDGDYNTVVGLPVGRLIRVLESEFNYVLE